ncbi:MAG: Ig-like domain-containing protein, partial [Archangium sp.]|nr:Ig-like domain-containing protein [Archangium sp.]
MTKVCAWGLLLLGLTACPPTIDTGEDGGGTGPIVVGPNGGLFVRSGLAIDVPKGAVTDETIITITIVDTGIPEVADRKRISFGYRLSPTSLRFATPAKLYLPWVDDRVPRAVDPGTFDMRRQAGADAALALPGAKTGMLGEASFVEAPTERLGLFWVTSPSQPNVARLELDPEEVTIRVGEMTQLTARVVAPTGETVDAEVTWAAVAPRIGTVSSSGLFSATAPGVATVTARVGMQSATAKVNVVGDSSGPSTFSHQNPFPTGNDLWGGALA